MSTSGIDGEPRATSARCTENELILELADGRTLSVPIVWFPRLAVAGSEARNTVELIGGGEGLHWPLLDEDISVNGLLSGRASIEQRPAHA